MVKRSVRVKLNISEEEYLKVYKGTARSVFAYSVDGISIRFPVNILQAFVQRNGIHGEFIIYYDANNKFESIKKVA